MYPEVYENSALMEHRFWLQILGDHSRFILNTLSPNEVEEIERAQRFIIIFDNLLEQSRQHLSGPMLQTLTRQAYFYAGEIREFKLHLLRRQLAGQLSTGLPPTFFNHMLNELEEYMRVLCMLLSGQTPVFHPVHIHLLWLPDGSGHAGSIEDGLDEVEKNLRKESKRFKEAFTNLYLKALEMAGYMRTNLKEFPALNLLNSEAHGKMVEFMEFLDLIKRMRLSKEVLGTLMPLIPDHMYREECYYLNRLSMVSETDELDCDPAKPRIEV